MYQQVIDPATGTASTSVVLRTIDKAFIPLKAGNDDYAAYLAWVADGNAALPAN